MFLPGVIRAVSLGRGAASSVALPPSFSSLSLSSPPLPPPSPPSQFRAGHLDAAADLFDSDIVHDVDIDALALHNVGLLPKGQDVVPRPVEHQPSREARQHEGKTTGIQAKIFCCIGSGGAGLSRI